jgi:hypothetical protein
MQNFMLLLCAIVVVTYLVQFLAYSIFTRMDVGTDFIEGIGLPAENEPECLPVVQDQLAVPVL